jgi:hypothetical protein
MEPRNRFLGIDSARLGIDSWAFQKVYKYWLWKKGEKSSILLRLKTTVNILTL